MGPCIATRDSFAWPPVLGIRSYVNGELRQNSDTGLLIFGIDHVVSELSRGMTLRPGTIISMGTPAGVGMGFVPPRFLRSGDVVECVIDGIGSIRNTVIDER
jgi:2-keto-4-pentenoate hydratase/2-oxohepta-3-ene-1,7-dioic acid hydratase in catechol pathway